MKNRKESAVRTVLIVVLVLLLLMGAVGLIVRFTRQKQPQGPPDVDAPVLSERLELDKDHILF